MDVFGIRDRVVEDYRSYTTSFVEPRDDRIAAYLQEQLDSEKQWPDPWLSLNPSFAPGGSISEAVGDGLLHPECASIFKIKADVADRGTREIQLHRHQRDAIEVARSGSSYVLTTGTGSGKSLAYIIPIVDRVLREKEADPSASPSIKAIVVYPMNALANSQRGELEKFLTYGYGKGQEPVTYARYTGQETDAERESIMARPPDILLTNYVMLELLLTRPREREKLIRAAHGLRFLVLDELHTYRGRQGADVAMLVRRVRDACQAPDLQVVGTSATMSSEGTRDEQRATVARVASRLFGDEVTPQAVIGETLVRATQATDLTTDTLRANLTAAPSTDYVTLAEQPLAAWVETEFGLATDHEHGDLVRSQPTTVAAAAANLAALTETSEEQAAAAIRDILHAGSRAQHPITGRPLFAFRLHQFISKGDTLYTSLEAEDARYLTTRYQVAVPNEPAKPLIPLVFCRECGQEYLTVFKALKDGDLVIAPRRDRDEGTGEGYLYISTDYPWPVSTYDALADNRLPDSWTTLNRQGQLEVVRHRRDRVPESLRVTPDGTVTEAEDTGLRHEHVTDAGVRAAFIPGQFSFCLRCGTSYEQRGSDFARLASVGSEGRSSAVTVISTSVVANLQQTPGLDPEARKLLTFVDNRQDASLQSGHVNDFVQVSHLRGALAKAVATAGPEGLTTSEMPREVVNALGLDFADYSAVPDALRGQRAQIEETLRNVAGYRLLADLERGWRVNMPNLEQTGKLVVDYLDLEELAARDDFFANSHSALLTAAASVRQEVLRDLLNELRRSLAIDTPFFEQQAYETMRSRADSNLRDPWSMDPDEKMVTVRVAYPRSGSGGTPADALFVSGRSAFARYLRREGTLPHVPKDTLTTSDAEAIIADLLAVAERAGLVTSVEDRDRGVGYRVRAEAMLWKPGNGQYGAEDPVRRVGVSEKGPRVNPYFRDLYSGGTDRLAGLFAREHTAQVPSDIREQREEQFREGELPLLFCSPTMELGVDISSLNAVAMRNVPPTPANYAQRSGRAGRSGQQALVVTYCATGNAHDTYYFARSDRMVAGSVTAPRLDLANEDLLRAHLHALWLSETGIDLGSSMLNILDIDPGPQRYGVRQAVAEQAAEPAAQERALARAVEVLADITPELRTSGWWDEEWPERVIRQAPRAFDLAAERWRELYRGAEADQAEQNRIVTDPTTNAFERRAAEARRRDAEQQMKLLLNDTKRAQSDFYPYRYFASEGFLPGYSFPRLPLAAYIPGQRRIVDGDYVQRPRFLAVSEFGPGALIYHEGSRYLVDRVQVPIGDPTQPGSVLTTEMRRCAECGYWHDRPMLVTDCQFCGATLPATTKSLMQLRTVFTRRRERISADEEERRRSGFDVQVSYRFADRGGQRGRTAATAAGADGEPLLELVYGDAATIRMANMGRRRRASGVDGFWLDAVQGRWLPDQAPATSSAASSPQPGQSQIDDDGRAKVRHRVIPYVEDTRNILITRLVQPGDVITATTLRTALERGIEAAFQLEDSELASQALPDADGRGRALFMEANEGGAGVLRRLLGEPGALAVAAAAALEIAHFTTDGEDTLADATGDARCERACYDCLLSYANQTEHAHIDRHQIRDILVALAGSSVSNENAAEDSTHVADLRARCDSQLERDFLDYLIDHDHALPVAAQEFISEAAARPDFTFECDGGPVAVFLDGPHHDDAYRAERDAQVRERLRSLGWAVVEIRHDDNLAEKLAKYSSVFGKGR